MPNSRRFNKLVRRIEYLENSMLPASKINGNYTRKEQDLIRGFVVLVHAEVESYLEDRASAKIKSELSKWRNDRKRSNCIKAAMAFLSNEINFLNDTNKKSLEHRVVRVVNHYLGLIQKNNGIKKKNVYALLLPIGLEVENIDPLWLEEMNSFGAFRGEIVHTTHSVQSPIDRDVQLVRINTKIIPGLRIVDQDIAAL